jgi:hypothetical protein
MRGALITVKCDCGEVRYVEYGGQWTCSCGRRWNTNQIPADEYWSIMYGMRRFRLKAMGLALIVGLAVVAFARITHGPILPLMIPVMMGWLFFYMPQWRRRVRAAARSLPTWKLHPE